MTFCKQCAIVALCSTLASFNTMPLSAISTSETSSPSDFPAQPRKDLSLEEQQDHWSVLNNSLLSVERRAEAERALIEANDVRMLRIAFRGLIEPIEVIYLSDPEAGDELRVESMSVTAGMGHFFPTIGSLKGDAQAGAPIAAQIAYARGRIYSHLARHAEPEEERHRIYEEILHEAKIRPEEGAKTEWLIQTIMTGSRRNWTPKVREHLVTIYDDTERLTHTRRAAGHTLLDMHHATPATEHRAIRERLIATAWAERGSEFALVMGRRLGTKDPRVAMLKLDVYDHEFQRAGHATPSAVHLIDTYFDNVSGLYVDPRSPEGHRRWIEYRDRRMALQREASRTGDDTKLRKFAEEHAEQQRKEFEQRVEKIDAWIAQNRDRLEREAAEFAQERERERKRESQQQP